MIKVENRGEGVRLEVSGSGAEIMAQLVYAVYSIQKAYIDRGSTRENFWEVFSETFMKTEETFDKGGMKMIDLSGFLGGNNGN